MAKNMRPVYFLDNKYYEMGLHEVEKEEIEYFSNWEAIEESIIEHYKNVDSVADGMFGAWRIKIHDLWLNKVSSTNTGIYYLSYQLSSQMDGYDTDTIAYACVILKTEDMETLNTIDMQFGKMLGETISDCPVIYMD